MREILFRGKDICDNEWIYGQWLPKSGTICTETNIEGTTLYNDLFVKPDTIGQYTGLTDKNGTKIFEGDILKWRKTKIIVNYIGCTFLGYDIHGVTHNIPVVMTECEVIGNIYDNPELLGD